MGPTRTTETCTIEGCERPLWVKGDGLCNAHYLRKRRHGSPLLGERRQRGECSVDGCSSPHFAKGCCSNHYREKRRQSQPRSVRLCLVCAAPIPATRAPNAIYCSNSCMVAEHNARAAGRSARGRARVCVQCGEDLPDDLHRRAVLCSEECRKARKNEMRRGWVLARYGLTPAAYEALLKRQKGGCYGCHATVDLCVDHDAITGQVRGILCRTCNTGIGAMRHDPKVLTRLVRYLKEPPATR